MNLSRFGKGMFRTLSLVRDQAYSFHPRDVLSGGKDRRMKIVDGKYQYSKFSKEDLKMYREVLEQLPYDAELEAFFIEQGALDRRIRQQDARHIAPIPLEYIDNYTMRQSAEDEYFLLANNKKLHDAMERLTPEQFERTYELFFEGKTTSQIAERDSKWEGSVRHCMDRALKRLRKQYEE